MLVPDDQLQFNALLCTIAYIMYVAYDLLIKLQLSLSGLFFHDIASRLFFFIHFIMRTLQTLHRHGSTIVCLGK